MEGPGRSRTERSRWQTAVGVLGLVVVLWVGNNLFDTISNGGVGSGGGQGDRTPSGRAPTEQPTGGDDSGHDPPPFNHG